MTFHIPTAGPISSPYGSRRSRQTGQLRQHNGTDFAGSLGAPVYAVADGTIERVTSNGVRGFNCYGRVVILRVGDTDTRALYAHLHTIAVRQGDTVRAGDVIATLGQSNGSEWAPGTVFADGDCDATHRRFARVESPPRPHLHFEVRDGRYPTAYTSPRLDPIVWLTDRGLPYTENGRSGRPVRRLTSGPGPGEDPEDGPREAPAPRRRPSGSPLPWLALAALFGLAASR